MERVEAAVEAAHIDDTRIDDGRGEDGAERAEAVEVDVHVLEVTEHRREAGGIEAAVAEIPGEARRWRPASSSNVASQFSPINV